MAGEISHVVYAARVLTHLGSTVSRDDYWSGTLFPDIRHLGVISRHRTHPKDITLSTLAGDNDWQTGARVHAWVDSTRQHYLDEANIKESLPWHPFVPHALKLVEDEWIYKEFTDWDVVRRSLGKVHSDALELVPSKEHIKQWYGILQDYIASTPTDTTRKNLALGIGLSESSATEINMIVDRLKKAPATRELVEGCWHHIDTLLQ